MVVLNRNETIQRENFLPHSPFPTTFAAREHGILLLMDGQVAGHNRFATRPRLDGRLWYPASLWRALRCRNVIHDHHDLSTRKRID